MNVLMVFGDIRKGINAGLIDHEPFRGPGMFAYQCGHILTGDFLHASVISKNFRPGAHIDAAR